MQQAIGRTQLELKIGDITQVSADALVNAANSRLAGGGGVDGAIHRAGGPSIMEATRRLYPQGCPTGSAVITEAGRLPARYVIHAVGPVWNGGQQNEDALLASAYRRCLELATENACDSLAFPSLSTGAYRFPTGRAAGVALKTVIQFVKEKGRPQQVFFVLFDGRTYEDYAAALRELVAGGEV